MTLDVDWHALCAAVEEMGYVLFPKDMMIKFANERKEWEKKDRLIEEYIADVKRLEAEKAEMTRAMASTRANQCVSCGSEMPEGDMVCKGCYEKQDLSPCEYCEHGTAHLFAEYGRQVKEDEFFQIELDILYCPHCGRKI